MRIWSIHPTYLDRTGLVALWRETLLARKALKGKTKGYKNHPQLERFKEQKNPLAMISSYLFCVLKEAEKRGYNFNRDKVGRCKTNKKIKVTDSQISYEFNHLKKKLKKRSPLKYKELLLVKKPEPHPLFKVVKGSIEKWEKVRD